MTTLKDYNKLKNVNLSEIEKSHERTSLCFRLLEMYKMRNSIIPYIIAIFMTAITLIVAKLNLYEIYGDLTYLILILIYSATGLIGLVVSITYDSRIKKIEEILEREREARNRFWEGYYYWEVTDQLRR